MKNGLFHGYNCFATAVGQHFLNVKNLLSTDALVYRWTFDYNKYWVDDNVWSVGACVEAADYLLQYDLMLNDGIRIIEQQKNSLQDDLLQMNAQIAEDGSYVIMVDFYYLKSIEWERMKRFGYFPQHLPHFICVNRVEDDAITYQDPMYGFEGNMSMEDYEKSRKLTVCGVDKNWTYYVFDFTKQKKVSNEERIKFQLERYLNNQQYSYILKFAKSFIEKKEEFIKKGKFDWAFSFYLALESVTLQRQGFMMGVAKQFPQCQGIFSPLIRNWIKVRTSFLKIHKEKNTKYLADVNNVLNEIVEQEKDVPEILLERIVYDRR